MVSTGEELKLVDQDFGWVLTGASMATTRRRGFSCAVLDGKIYVTVLGGIVRRPDFSSQIHRQSAWELNSDVLVFDLKAECWKQGGKGWPLLHCLECQDTLGRYEMEP